MIFKLKKKRFSNDLNIWLKNDFLMPIALEGWKVISPYSLNTGGLRNYFPVPIAFGAGN